MNHHDIIDRRLVSSHGAIRAKFLRNPLEVRQFAMDNLIKWWGNGQACSGYDEWAQILADYDDGALADLLIEQTERGDRLRQASPFAGVLTQDERRAIFNAATRGGDDAQNGAL